VDHGVEVVVTENHVNRTAPSGWMLRLDRPLLRDGFSVASIPRMGEIRCHGKPRRGEIHWAAGLPEYRIHSQALNASTPSNGSLRSYDGGHVLLRFESHVGASGSVFVGLNSMKLVP
jgi:hypothetical protein